MTSDVGSGEAIFQDRENAVYDALRHLPPGLMLDVGAAVGVFTSIMLERSPSSRVVAFEPFPGNHPYLRQRIGSDPRVTIVEKAVSDHDGRSSFYVSSTVSESSTGGWSSMPGYSSVGYLGDSGGNSAGFTIEVDTTRVDDVVQEPVRFMKIDIQGGELNCLRGATRLLSKQDIDILFVEFDGELEILSMLSDLGYRFYDSEYLFIPKSTESEYPGWRTFRDLPLSVGRLAHRAWPLERPSEIVDYCRFLREEARRFGWIYTDMVCVSERSHSAFQHAADLAADT